MRWQQPPATVLQHSATEFADQLDQAMLLIDSIERSEPVEPGKRPIRWASFLCGGCLLAILVGGVGYLVSPANAVIMVLLAIIGVGLLLWRGIGLFLKERRNLKAYGERLENHDAWQQRLNDAEHSLAETTSQAERWAAECYRYRNATFLDPIRAGSGFPNSQEATPPLIPLGDIVVRTRARPVSLPVWLVLAHPEGLRVCGDLATPLSASFAKNTARSVVFNFATTLPPGHVLFHFVDPIQLGRTFEGIRPLAESRGGTFTTRPDAIDNLFQRLSDTAQHRIAKGLTDRDPFELLVVADAPHGFTSKQAQALAGLLASGPQVRIVPLILEDADGRWPSGVDVWSRYRDGGIVVEQGQANVGGKSFAAFDPTSELHDDEAAAFMSEITGGVASVAAERRAEMLRVNFGDIVDAQPATHTSERGLTIPIGRSGPDVISLTFDDDHAHGAVVGKAGYGKSNFFHVVIHSAAWRYGPDELELWLIDLKKGVEFQRYLPGSGESALPHVKVVAVDSDAEFGRAAIKELAAKLTERAAIMESVGANDLKEYRRSGRTMPRVLVIIDEFHKLFDDEATQDSIWAALADLAQQGRSFGVHLLLGSQSIVSGSKGQNLSKGQVAMKQLINRLALFSDAEDSKAMIGTDQATNLTTAGSAYLNTAAGYQANVELQIAMASTEVLADTARRIRSTTTSSDAQRTFIFKGSQDPARPPTSVKRAEDEFAIALGKPLSLADEVQVRLWDERRRIVALVGTGQTNEWDAVGLLSSAVLSFHAQFKDGRVVILDLLSRNSQAPTWLRKSVAPVQVSVQRGIDEVEIWLKEQARLLVEKAEPALVIGAGLHQLDLKPPTTDESGTPSSELMTLIKDGPRNRVWFAGWWDTSASLRNGLGREWQNLFGVRVLLNAVVDEAAEVVGQRIRQIGEHRALLFDRDDPANIQRFIPFRPAVGVAPPNAGEASTDGTQTPRPQGRY